MVRSSPHLLAGPYSGELWGTPTLYGRELRLPQQLIDPRVPSKVVFEEMPMDDVPKAYTQYAAKLNSHLRLAWKTALEVTTQAAQEENALNTALKSNTATVFKVGDRVCRRIPNHRCGLWSVLDPVVALVSSAARGRKWASEVAGRRELPGF
eukprot:scaffold35445_cov112-Isochrysis_galbana.AAC.1